MAPELSIPVLWSVDRAPHVAGRIDLYRDRLHLDGGSRDDRRTLDVDGADVAAVRIGREGGDRIGGRAVLLVELRDGAVLSVAGLQTAGTLHELAERIEAMAPGDG